ncbi:MAG: tetratricopeptide repeat protein [Meiothermus sp.]|nr:tetratricopeptide repeat protein [Meiothermus sp.]
MLIRLIVSIGLGALSVFGLAHAYQSLRATQTITAQQPLLDEGRYDEALSLLEAALKLQPQNPDLWEAKGRVNMLMSSFRPARREALRADSVAAYRRAIALDPLNARRMGHLVEAHLRFDQPEAALALLRRAYRRDPNNAGLYYFEGLALQRLGRLEEARSAYQVSDRIAPRSDGARGLQSLAAGN